MIVTPAIDSELREIVAPFVNARLDRKRDANGYVVDRTEFVDIAWGVVLAMDASIREVNDEGVGYLFDDRVQFVPWAEVREIVVRREGREIVAYRRVEALRAVA